MQREKDNKSVAHEILSQYGDKTYYENME